MKDIAGKWRVSFVDGDDSTLAGEIEVVQDEEEPTIFYLSGISNFFDLPLIYNGEALLTMGGLNLGTYAGRYNIYTVTLSEGGYVSWDMSTQYVAYPSSINGKFALVFGDNGSRWRRSQWHCLLGILRCCGNRKCRMVGEIQRSYTKQIRRQACLAKSVSLTCIRFSFTLIIHIKGVQHWTPFTLSFPYKKQYKR